MKNNTNKRPLIESNTRKPTDAEDWRRLYLNPLILITWELSLCLVYIYFGLNGLGSGAMEAIQEQAWGETALMLLLFMSYVNLIRGVNISWRALMLTLIALTVGYLINQYFVASTGNPYFQGILSGIAFFSDFAQPIAAGLYFGQIKKQYINNMDGIIRRDVILAGLHLGLAINHVFSFYLPIATCIYAMASGIIIVVFMAINATLLTAYCFYLLWNWRQSIYPMNLATII